MGCVVEGQGRGVAVSAADESTVAVPEAARRLAAMGVRWSERTIRRHLVPVSEWRGLTSGDVPCLRLGATYYVPTWWLREVGDALRVIADNSDK